VEFQYVDMDAEGKTYTGVDGDQLISPHRMFVVLSFLHVVFLRIMTPYRKCQIDVLPFYPLPCDCQYVRHEPEQSWFYSGRLFEDQEYLQRYQE